ncbi:hypothetical protein F7725_029190 [Dissostichus mawsoni]|uniref:Uncharacterized protein n=1 Tax=Dissostichus mawsoni TaxID=36200 RepID=A0A7J5XHQ2_DISMA|nr:hypothetical protein F7725_029190 [Dissostichus mawsoni]
MEEDDVSIREQNFHSQVREYIICFLLFAVLYIVSYCIITIQEEELYLCTFTLAVSGGAVFLLPFSIISNEILLSFPKNYYIQWLNGSLIHGLWNLVSLFSNLCLFVLMPFAYFFLESEGFAGSKKILEDLDEQIYCIHLQEEALQRRLNEERRPRTISVLMVVFNILYLLVDETAMPKGSTSLTPRNDDTTMTTIIGCCVSILVLSSALPVMSRTLGITRFDLLGDFGRFNWLGNFYIVLSYNMLFAVVTTLCLDKLQLSNSPTDPESGKLSANGHQKTLKCRFKHQHPISTARVIFYPLILAEKVQSRPLLSVEQLLSVGSACQVLYMFCECIFYDFFSVC